MNNLHARLSPSDHAWVKCPGKVREASSYVDVAGEAAIDGTGSHELLEQALIQGKPAAEFIGQTVGVGHHDRPLGWVVDLERAERVQMCLDYVARRYSELSAEFPNCTIHLTAEEKVYPGQFCNPPRDDWYGTADITIEVVNHEGKQEFLEVIDYKDGRMFVNVEDNSQLQSYWIGRAYASDCTLSWRSRKTVVQPKTNPPIRYTEDKDRNQLHLAYQYLSAAAKATDDPNAPLNAGAWCHWCPANQKRGGHCTKGVEQAAEEISSVIATVDESPMTSILDALRGVKVEDMDSADLAVLLDQEPMYQAAFDRIKREVEARVEQGLPVPGWGVVPGRETRTWVDDDKALNALKNARLKADQYRPRILITPAAAQKLLKKEQWERIEAEHVVSKPGKARVGRVAGHREVASVDKLFVDVDVHTKKEAATKAAAEAAAPAPVLSFM